MFGLSLGKILLVVAVIVILWRGARLLKAIQAGVERLARAAEEDQSPKPKPGKRVPPPGEPRDVDLVPCPHCGAYVPSGTFCPGTDRCVRDA